MARAKRNPTFSESLTKLQIQSDLDTHAIDTSIARGKVTDLVRAASNPGGTAFTAKDQKVIEKFQQELAAKSKYLISDGTTLKMRAYSNSIISFWSGGQIWLIRKEAQVAKKVQGAVIDGMLKSRLGGFVKLHSGNPSCALPAGRVPAAERKLLPPRAFGLPRVSKYPVYRLVRGKVVPSPSLAVAAKGHAKVQLDRGNLTLEGYKNILAKANKVLKMCRQAKRNPSKRAYHVVTVDERTDAITPSSSSPMTHNEAVTFLSKMSAHRASYLRHQLMGLSAFNKARRAGRVDPDWERLYGRKAANKNPTKKKKTATKKRKGAAKKGKKPVKRAKKAVKRKTRAKR